MSLDDILRDLADPERQRAEEVRRQQILDQVRGVMARPETGPEAPTDTELLEMIMEVFGIYNETPFNENYDPLIERLSFTSHRFEECDPAGLKTAWIGFLDENGLIWEWPMSFGMALWYEDHDSPRHAIAVYEHLYSEARRGSLDWHNSEVVEPWLMRLVDLYREAALYDRSRHLCELMEDYYNDGMVSPDTYAETLILRSELDHQAISGTFQADWRSVEERLKAEHGELFAKLDHRTKVHVTDAELWSSNHWMKLSPRSAVLHWSLALESEFDAKVFQSHKERPMWHRWLSTTPRRETLRTGGDDFLI